MTRRLARTNLTKVLIASVGAGRTRNRLRNLTRDELRARQSLSCADWIEQHFWIPEPDPDTGLRGPMRLFPHQRWMLDAAHARNPDGTFRYSTVVWSDIKKSAKSTIAAAVARYRAEMTPYAEIYCIANDLKQAESRVFAYLARRWSWTPATSRAPTTAGRTTTGSCSP